MMNVCCFNCHQADVPSELRRRSRNEDDKLRTSCIFRWKHTRASTGCNTPRVVVIVPGGSPMFPLVLKCICQGGGQQELPPSPSTVEFDDQGILDPSFSFTEGSSRLPPAPDATLALLDTALLEILFPGSPMFPLLNNIRRGGGRRELSPSPASSV